MVCTGPSDTPPQRVLRYGVRAGTKLGAPSGQSVKGGEGGHAHAHVLGMPLQRVGAGGSG